MSNRILVANIGSTSFKFQLLEMPSETLLASGRVERIGLPGESPWQVLIGGTKAEGSAPFPDYETAIRFAGEKVEAGGAGSFADAAAFGFKPVMARDISGTQIMDERVLKAMEDLYTLLPVHNPAYVNGVRCFNALYPAIPCIGTFETAFYDRMPEENTWFPVPHEWREKYGIRRTGFHGASHRYVTQRTAELRSDNGLRIISCHLGGSSSIAAVRNGVAINSSWGMTPQSGLPQNNRVGDFDVFAALYLARDLGLGIDGLEKALASQSGLQGMSGLANGDIRDIATAAAKGEHNPAMALKVFAASIRKFIGQFILELNGLDVLVFTAGIGENSTDLRAAVCADLDFIGLELDPAVNAVTRAKEAIISTPSSRVEVRVIPTNEEIVIARNAWALLQQEKPAGA